MTRRSRAGGVGLVLLAAATGCSPDMPTQTNNLPDVEGLWSYTASEMRLVGGGLQGSCEIRDVTLDIGPWWDTGFYGRSVGGRLVCNRSLVPLSGPLADYPIRRGGSVHEFIAFDFGSPDWRHEGTIKGDTMSGAFRLKHGSFSMEGRFRAVREPATATRSP